MVIDPNSTTHTLKVIPRFYPSNDITVTLYNESSQEDETLVTTYNVDNNKLVINFTYTFVENDKRQIKIVEGSDVIFRGKLFATSQEPQEYKLTQGVYYD